MLKNNIALYTLFAPPNNNGLPTFYGMTHGWPGSIIELLKVIEPRSLFVPLKSSRTVERP